MLLVILSERSESKNLLLVQMAKVLEDHEPAHPAAAWREAQLAPPYVARTPRLADALAPLGAEYFSPALQRGGQYHR